MEVSKIKLFEQLLTIKDDTARKGVEVNKKEIENIRNSTFAKNVLEFGADPTGVIDSADAFQDAIDTCMLEKVNLYIPSGVYIIKKTLTIGNGSPTKQSTEHNFKMFGDGAGLDELTFADTQKSTIKWTGLSGGTMLQIRGPITKIMLSDFQLDCNSLANTGLLVIHCAFSDFERINVSKFKKCAYILTTDNPSLIPGVTYGCASNVWMHVSATGPLPGASCLLCDGGAGSIFNTARNLFIEPEFTFGEGASFGVKLRYADHNYFIGGDFYTSGKSSACVLERDPNHPQFPSNNTFIATALVNGVSGVSGLQSSGHEEGYNYFILYPQADGEPLPTIDGVSFSTFSGKNYINSVKQDTLSRIENKTFTKYGVPGTYFIDVPVATRKMYSYDPSSVMITILANVKVAAGDSVSLRAALDGNVIPETTLTVSESGPIVLQKFVYFGTGTHTLSLQAKHSAGDSSIEHCSFTSYFIN